MNIEKLQNELRVKGYAQYDIDEVCRLEQEYEESCEDIAKECAEEGYPAHGSNYSLRCEELRKYYDSNLQYIYDKYSIDEKDDEYNYQHAVCDYKIIRKYLVVDQPKEGNGDQFVKIFESLNEANKEAEFQWGYLTQRERTKRRIFVGHVENTERYLNPDAFDEYGAVDYGAFHSIDYDETYFDSDAEK